MRKKHIGFIAAGTILVLLLGWALWIRPKYNPQAKVTVDKFYHMWTDSSIHPLVEFSYRGSPYLTREFQRRLDRIGRTYTVGSFDPVVCQTLLPKTYTVSFVDGDETHPTLSVQFPTTSATVSVLKQADGTWLIDSIQCPEAAVSFSAANRPAAEEILKNTINDLSPEKAVLGGTFHVIDIAWQDNGSALVTYEDGHILLKAHATFSMDANGPVVKSFIIEQ